MKTCTVVVEGCDDQTEITLDVSDSELEFLERVASLVNDASTYQCMPRLHVGIPVKDEP